MVDIKLKVMEAVQDDVNKGIIKIDSSFMKELGVIPGNFVSVKGERETIAIVDRAYPGDIGLNIIRMDGNTRKNSRASVGEFVELKKVEVKEAESIVLLPAHKGIIVKANPLIFKHFLMNRPIVHGDVISFGNFRKRMVNRPQDIFSMMDHFAGLSLGSMKFIVNSSKKEETKYLYIGPNTRVDYLHEGSKVHLKEELNLGINYEDIGGLREEIKKVREMVELPLKHPEIFEKLGIDPPTGVLLHGPPGTGKTLLARAVASETNSHIVTINGPEVMGKFYGESEENLRKKFDEAIKNSPSIIFFDEIDAIASKREESRGDVEKRVVAQLLSLMDGLKKRGKVIIIAATNMPDSIDPALRRPGRFDREIEVGVPSTDGRLEILKIHTRSMPLDKSVNLDEISRVTHGFVGADLNALAKESAMEVLRRILPEIYAGKSTEDRPISSDVLEKLLITQSDFNEALKQVRPSAMREVLVETPNVCWSDIGGHEDIKQKLKESVELPLKNPGIYQKMGIRPPKGVLLYGPPGTGKTLLAKAIAKESEANFILVNGPSLLSKWVGESEKAVREIFRKARQTSPTILFFDEIDSLVPLRRSDSNDVISRVVNQMLTEIDGLEGLHDVYVVAATNRPDMIDPAFLRQGRFDRLIYVGVPNDESRLKTFKIYLSSMPLLPDVNINELVKLTENYVGSDIEGICREAAILAIRSNSEFVSQKNFIDSINIIKPSVDESIIEMYDDLQENLTKKRVTNKISQDNTYFG